MVDKLIGNRKKPERDLRVGGLIVIFVAPGLALMGWTISFVEEKVLIPLLGVAGLVLFVGIGLLAASNFLERANAKDYPDNRNSFG